MSKVVQPSSLSNSRKLYHPQKNPVPVTLHSCPHPWAQTPICFLSLRIFYYWDFILLILHLHPVLQYSLLRTSLYLFSLVSFMTSVWWFEVPLMTPNLHLRPPRLNNHLKLTVSELNLTVSDLPYKSLVLTVFSIAIKGHSIHLFCPNQKVWSHP